MFSRELKLIIRLAKIGQHNSWRCRLCHTKSSITFAASLRGFTPLVRLHFFHQCCASLAVHFQRQISSFGFSHQLDCVKPFHCLWLSVQLSHCISLRKSTIFLVSTHVRLDNTVIDSLMNISQSMQAIIDHYSALLSKRENVRNLNNAVNIYNTFCSDVIRLQEKIENECSQL